MPASRRKRSTRQKRASVQDIYNKGCKTGGYCPDDVRNKVESTTLADRLLQWLGSFIYLGNLGIGTGKGSGGSTGYTPLGGVTGPKVISEVNIARPSVPVDPLGGTQGIPLDVLEPTSSSIVPLLEGGLPEVSVIDAAPDFGPAEIDITTHSEPSRPASTPHPAIVSTEDSVLTDIQPGPSGPTRIGLNIDTGLSDTVRLNISSDASVNINTNVFVDPQSASNTVTWGDEIPLNPIRPFEEFEIEAQDLPRQSSPLETVSSSFRRVRERARDLYNRYTEQRPTRNIDFLGNPSRAVQFEFENPAYTEEDITRIFEQDIDNVTAAPDSDFQDIVSLSRPRFAETPEGTIRVSRLGVKATMKTRSGLQIGKRVHFFYDISPIRPNESIELRSFGQYSGENIFHDAQTESVFFDDLEGGSLYSEEALLDPLSESFERSHIVINFDVMGETMDMPTIPPGFALKAYVPIGPEGFHIRYPNIPDTIPNEIQDTAVLSEDLPLTPLGPQFSVFVDGESFYLPPFLQKRRKKISFLF